MSGDSDSLLFHLGSALLAALVGAVVAVKLRQSVVIGYLLAGLAIGPFTPGFIGDARQVEALAEIGIVFLMFVIGVQLSFRELVRAGRVALLGSTLQVLLTLGGGYLIGRLLGFSSIEALFLGAVVSNSSSTVLAKVLAERDQTDTRPARTALAWSSVQDLGTVVLVAGLTALSTVEEGGTDLSATAWKAAAFAGLLVPAALFALPRLFARISALHNREIFVLTAGCVALLMSYLSEYLGVSTALGAFLAGAILGDSQLSHRILGETMPLRDVFSGLFFVSVGMLIDPRFIVSHAPSVLLVTVCIVVLKGGLTVLVSRRLGSSWMDSAVLGIGLAQCGEFSLLMARLGQRLEVVSSEVFNTMLSSAALSILAAPHLFRLALPFGRWLARTSEPVTDAWAPEPPLVDHVVVCGYGRVGQVVTRLLHEQGVPYVVIDEDQDTIRALRRTGGHGLVGDAGRSLVLERAGLALAKMLIVAVPDQVVVRQALEHARSLNPTIAIVARTHGERDRQQLYALGINEAVLGEHELALELSRRALQAAGTAPKVIEAAIERSRRSGHL
jgi:CPA2 family monovalent cation:H+ antiporter-2